MSESNSKSQSTHARRLLLITYWFPPAIGAAAERMIGFAHHLSRLGWDVHVLTTTGRQAAPSISGVTVHGVEDPLAKDQPFANFDPRISPPKWKSLAREFLFPDRFFKWRKAAMAVGRELLHELKFDVILASFPPASVIQLAVGLSRESGVPLVTDFRDRWLGPGGYEPSLSFVRQRHERLKKQAVVHSSRVIAVSEPMAEIIATSQQIPRAKVAVIPNGYETRAREIEELESVRADAVTSGGERLIIAHVGTVIARNRPEIFFESLKKIKSDRRLEDVQFRFVGNLSEDYVQSLGLNNLIHVTGIVSREIALREMASADALLLLTGSYVGRWGASAKLFEYVQTGLPVLCLEESPGSNDRQLLEQFIGDRAFFAPMHNAGAISNQLREIRQYRMARPNPSMVLDGSFRDYSRENLTKRLADVLKEVVGP